VGTGKKIEIVLLYLFFYPLILFYERHYAMDGIQAVEIKDGYRLQALTNIMWVGDGD